MKNDLKKILIKNQETERTLVLKKSRIEIITRVRPLEIERISMIKKEFQTERMSKSQTLSRTKLAFKHTEISKKMENLVEIYSWLLKILYIFLDQLWFENIDTENINDSK